MGTSSWAISGFRENIFMFSYPVMENRILFSPRCILHPVLTVLSTVHPSPHVLTLFRKHISVFLSISSLTHPLHYLKFTFMQVFKETCHNQLLLKFLISSHLRRMNSRPICSPMVKDSLAYEVKKHYITKTLPGQIKNHPGYLNYQDINYRYYNQNKHGFIFRCTRYLLPDNKWTNRKAVQTA